jgi:hypothetical protein
MQAGEGVARGNGEGSETHGISLYTYKIENKVPSPQLKIGFQSPGPNQGKKRQFPI